MLQLLARSCTCGAVEPTGPGGLAAAHRPRRPAVARRGVFYRRASPSTSGATDLAVPVATRSREVGSSAATVRAATSNAATPHAPPPIRQGVTAQSARIRFVPHASSCPAATAPSSSRSRPWTATLQVPDDVSHVGWWDGSAYAGDPFGSTVIAGHVDSRSQGFGFFAQLLFTQVGDLVTCDRRRTSLTYRVVSATLVNKDALASESDALSQRGPHRLVLITCSGQWHPGAALVRQQPHRDRRTARRLIAEPLEPSRYSALAPDDRARGFADAAEGDRGQRAAWSALESRAVKQGPTLGS